MATGHYANMKRTTNWFIPPLVRGYAGISRADHVPHDCATVLYGWLTTPLVTHQVGRPPPRSALAESLLGLLRSAQSEAGYRQQEADSKTKIQHARKHAGATSATLPALGAPISRSFRA